MLLASLADWMNPETIISMGGFWLVIFIVFAETGLLIGLFLPGDALLFAAGLLTASGTMGYSIYSLLLWLNIAAVAGNLVGYKFGKKAGVSLFTREDSLFFKKKYVKVAEAFYLRYGGITIIIGRFLPVIRTLAPMLAGVASVKYSRFIFYSIAGSLLWTIFMAGSGYFLVQIYPPLQYHIGKVTAILILLSMGTVLHTYFREKRKNSISSPSK